MIPAYKTLQMQNRNLVAENNQLLAELAEAKKDSHPAVGSLVARNSELSEELDAANAEIERLTGCLKKANELAEKFEREWYLCGDELDAAKKEIIQLNEALDYWYRVGQEG